MSNALRDQLLKAGLVNDKQVKKAVKDKQKETRQQQGQNKPLTAEQERQRIQQAQAEKAARDRELNRQRQEAAEQKALQAQTRQLIETHRQEPGDGEHPYNFTDGNTVKRLYVSEAVRKQIASGRLAIVRDGKAYALIPADIADKIGERDIAAIVLWNKPDAKLEESADDPYAQYQVPDDLIW